MSDAQQDTRNDKRLSIYLFADCHSGDGDKIRIRVRNLSKHGLGGQLEEEWHPSKGQRVSLAFRGLELVNARIAWIDGRNLGIAFDKPIDAHKVLPGLAGRSCG